MSEKSIGELFDEAVQREIAAEPDPAPTTVERDPLAPIGRALLTLPISLDFSDTRQIAAGMKKWSAALSPRRPSIKEPASGRSLLAFPEISLEDQRQIRELARRSRSASEAPPP